jgi:hypothetical protein
MITNNPRDLCFAAHCRPSDGWPPACLAARPGGGSFAASRRPPQAQSSVGGVADDATR